MQKQGFLATQLKSYPLTLKHIETQNYQKLCKIVFKIQLVQNQINTILTVMILSFRTDRSGQTVQTQIRLLLEEQSDQGLHCLLFPLHFFNEIPLGLASLSEF